MQSITPIDRDLALARLRRLTYGAAAGAAIALLGVSYVAAASNPGRTSTSTALNGATDANGSSNPTDSTNSVPDDQNQGGFGLFGQPPSANTGGGGSGVVTTGGS
jgi:hypothetical protein